MFLIQHRKVRSVIGYNLISTTAGLVIQVILVIQVES